MGGILLKYGGLAGCLLIIVFWYSLTTMGTGMSYAQSEMLGYAAMIFVQAILFLGIRQYRDRLLGGYISFGQVFGFGVLIANIMALMFGAFIVVFYKYIEPGFAERFYQMYIDSIKSSDLSPAEIEEQLSYTESMRKVGLNAYFQGAIMFFTVSAIGTFASLLFAFVLKRKN